MKDIAILILVVAAWCFPYSRVPHKWRDMFTRSAWR